MDGPGGTQAEVEAAVRRYVGRVARRYIPFAIGLVTLLLVVTLVPTTSPRSADNVSSGPVGTGDGNGATPAGLADTVTTIAAPEQSALGPVGDGGTALTVP